MFEPKRKPGERILGEKLSDSLFGGLKPVARNRPGGDEDGGGGNEYLRGERRRHVTEQVTAIVLRCENNFWLSRILGEDLTSGTRFNLPLPEQAINDLKFLWNASKCTDYFPGTRAALKLLCIKAVKSLFAELGLGEGYSAAKAHALIGAWHQNRFTIRDIVLAGALTTQAVMTLKVARMMLHNNNFIPELLSDYPKVLKGNYMSWNIPSQFDAVEDILDSTRDGAKGELRLSTDQKIEVVGNVDAATITRLTNGLKSAIAECKEGVTSIGAGLLGGIHSFEKLAESPIDITSIAIAEDLGSLVPDNPADFQGKEIVAYTSNLKGEILIRRSVLTTDESIKATFIALLRVEREWLTDWANDHSPPAVGIEESELQPKDLDFKPMYPVVLGE